MFRVGDAGASPLELEGVDNFSEDRVFRKGGAIGDAVWHGAVEWAAEELRGGQEREFDRLSKGG